MAESGDGGSAQSFHTACDKKGPTVTIVKTTAGFVFGGAADKAWVSPNGAVASSVAFLFCLTCAGAQQNGTPQTAPSQLNLTGTGNDKALQYFKGSGPAFGPGYDLFIANQPGGTSKQSYSGLGYSYVCPGLWRDDAKCKTYLAGSYQFTIADYEVFVIKAK